MTTTRFIRHDDGRKKTEPRASSTGSDHQLEPACERERGPERGREKIGERGVERKTDL